MSTAINSQLQENTTGADQNNEDNMYRYGRPGTDALSIGNPDKKARSPRKIDVVTSIDNKIEIIKQRWNGTVIDCSDQELTARLEDLTNPQNPDEIVVLSTEEIENRDQPLIKTGAMFLWHIGYRYGPKYPRERFSKISFRRLAKWTEGEIQDAEKQAKEYADFFFANSPHTT